MRLQGLESPVRRQPARARASLVLGPPASALIPGREHDQLAQVRDWQTAGLVAGLALLVVQLWLSVPLRQELGRVPLFVQVQQLVLSRLGQR